MFVHNCCNVVINEGNVDGDTFCNFLETNIFPLLLPFDGSSLRSVLILDNASIHHVERIYQLAEVKGCLLWFLPAYSPDLNPIEEVFSKVKAVSKNNKIAFQSCANDTLSLLMYAAFTMTTVRQPLCNPLYALSVKVGLLVHLLPPPPPCIVPGRQPNANYLHVYPR